MKDDMISRQAAIETVRKAQSIGQAHRMLVQLPPVQPSVSKMEIVGDTISRQAALDAMETWDKFGCDPDGKLVRYDDDKHYIPYVHYEDMVHAIKHLPPAQPVEDARAMCSECDAWNKYKNYPQPEQFNPCTVCQEFDCSGCKFRRT